MHKRPLSSVILAVGSTLVALALCEAIVRAIGRTDEDGNYFVGTLRCYPYHVPASAVKAKLAGYRASTDSFLIYDAMLGWAPRPSSRSRNGLYAYNRDAIRADAPEAVISKTPASGVLRIAIFGDSFTHGDELPYHDTWGDHLERALARRGRRAEVLNFGVGAYGMDQCLLRWRQAGASFTPQIVVLGLQVENLDRNVNLMRAIYLGRTHIPFTKPRFVLEHDRLQLVNAPTTPPEAIPTVIDAFGSWQYAPYEYWYEVEKYQERPWFHSKLISFAWALIDRYATRSRARDQMVEALGLKILTTFKEEVEQSGTMFYVVYLPIRERLQAIARGRPSPDEEFLRAVEAVMPVIRPEARLLPDIQTAGMQAMFQHNHYSGRTNAIIGEVIAERVLTAHMQSARSSGDTMPNPGR